jgi:hypothetical protein
VTNPDPSVKDRGEKPVTLDQRLLAEAVRIHEDALGFAADEPRADERARAAGGNFERRLAVRAGALSIAGPLREALRQLRGGSRLVVGAGLVLAVVAGFAATQAVFGSSTGKPVNFFWVLGSLLGVHTLALLIWLVFIVVRPEGTSGGFLGAAAAAVSRRINRWLHKGPVHAAAAQASVTVFASGAVGRWTFSTITHALWLAFLSGCIAMVLLTLSAKQYSFAWETTILSESNYMALAGAIGILPAALGFPVPDPEQVAASRWTGDGEPAAETREAWAGLLVGAIAVYGLLPRALVLLVSLAARSLALRRYRLDTSRPGFARLQTRVMPAARLTGVVDPEGDGTGTAANGAGVLEAPPIAPDGPAAILGLEIEPPATPWPPDVAGVDWLDLGFVDSRSDRHGVIERIVAAAVPPRAAVVVCSLAATPDRGAGAFVRTLQETTRIAVALVLGDGEKLRQRGHLEQVAQRIDDWRNLATRAGVPGDHVVEVDLDHLTDASRARLASLLGTETASAPHTRRIEDAFDLIVGHAGRWPGQPGAAEQAELQRDIARLYQGGGSSWRDLLRIDVKDGVPKLDDLRSGADRMIGLLPARLRLNSRWMAAGALAGALGCVAAATVVSPVAIAALPAWAGLGAAVSALMGPAGSGKASTAETAIDLTEAVNGAALFAVVLHLQGRDEAAITRVIDRMAGEENPPAIHGVDDARAWLHALRDRFDRALAEEHAT